MHFKGQEERVVLELYAVLSVRSRHALSGTEHAAGVHLGGEGLSGKVLAGFATDGAAVDDCSL
jgi:hypothetical protein